MSSARTLPWDWYPGTIPSTVNIDERAYVETSFSFLLYRSELPGGVTMGRGASTYLGTMFDVGPAGRVTLGEYTLVHGARIVCDAAVTLEDYTLVSWNVVLMDTYRVSFDPVARRAEVLSVPGRTPRRLEGSGPASLLPGVTVGEGSIVGARSVVTRDVEPFTIVAGNPARVIRRLTDEEMARGRAS
jgi:carbonic anhydrase/acetyltransferase-like protein (isoleucine patch superfamily)